MAGPNNGNPDGGAGGGAPSWERVLAHGLPLTLAARLAAGRATIGALRTLTSGTVLRLDTMVGEPSRLTVDDVVLATGEVVDIQGHLALRLTRLGRDDD